MVPFRLHSIVLKLKYLLLLYSYFTSFLIRKTLPGLLVLGLLMHKPQAQVSPIKSTIKAATLPVAPDNKVYVFAEEMPELQVGGGMKGITDYFFKHFRLSAAEAKAATGGSVGLDFIVNETGYVTNVRILRSGGASIDAAALRVIRGMPRFRPGRQNGVPVKVKLSLPISCIKIQ